MYMKKLCVVSDVIGNRDVISNGRNGYVCNKEEEFVKAILENNTAYIKQAYDDIMEKYNTAVMAHRYAQIYNNN